MRIGLTGATGLIGQAFGTAAAEQGFEIVAYTRDPGRLTLPFASECRPIKPQSALPLDASGVNAFVHLAGEPILGLWSDAKKERIVKSRVDFTQRIVRCLACTAPRPRALICASATGFYGDRGDEILTENSVAGKDFLAQVCTGWEASAMMAEQLDIRVVTVRTGVVLANEGGAFPLMRRAFKCGVGGRLGSGRQWMPWVHIEDHIRMMLHALKDPLMHGPVNLCAPGQATNGMFTRELARAVKRPAFMHVPRFLLRMLPGGMGSMMLASQRATPAKMLAGGYHFLHPTLDKALADLVHKA